MLCGLFSECKPVAGAAWTGAVASTNMPTARIDRSFSIMIALFAIVQFQSWEAATLIFGRRQPYPVLDRQLSRAALVRERPFDLPVSRRLRGLFRRAVVGNSRSVHGGAASDRCSHAPAAVPLHRLDLRTAVGHARAFRAHPNRSLNSISVRLWPFSGIPTGAPDLPGLGVKLTCAGFPSLTQSRLGSGSEAFSRQVFLGVWLQLTQRCAQQ